jgi:hypothetical protein
LCFLPLKRKGKPTNSLKVAIVVVGWVFLFADLKDVLTVVMKDALAVVSWAYSMVEM